MAPLERRRDDDARLQAPKRPSQLLTRRRVVDDAGVGQTEILAQRDTQGLCRVLRFGGANLRVLHKPYRPSQLVASVTAALEATFAAQHELTNDVL